MRWSDLDPSTRRRAAEVLRSRIGLEDQDALRREIPDNPDWHVPYVGWGAEIRAVLEPELPEVDWSKAWVGAVEAAVLPR